MTYIKNIFSNRIKNVNRRTRPISYGIKKNWQKIILVVYVFLLPVISFADGTQPICNPNLPCDPACGKICNPLVGNVGITDVPTFIKTILEGMLKIGIPVVALAIVYCGFLFVAARGNTEKVTKAKEALLYTVIGAAILLGSWAIAEMISATVTGLSA